MSTTGSAQRVVIGMDPHKRSATIEVMTAEEAILADEASVNELLVVLSVVEGRGDECLYASAIRLERRQQLARTWNAQPAQRRADSKP